MVSALIVLSVDLVLYLLLFLAALAGFRQVVLTQPYREWFWEPLLLISLDVLGIYGCLEELSNNS